MLKKRDLGGPLSNAPVSKNIPVVDKNGNKHILKATVISVSSEVKKSLASDEITEDFYTSSFGAGLKIVEPPLSPAHLAVIQENSSELGQILDAMVTGVVGFGGRVIQREMTEAVKKKYENEIEQEAEHLRTFFQFPNSEGSFTKLLKESHKDYESTGNMYWELIPDIQSTGRYSSINKLDISTMRVCTQDKNLTRYGLKYIDRNFQVQTKYFLKKFRRYVQVVNSKKVFFKEFGDPRTIDNRTGQIVDKLQVPNFPKKFMANEVWQRKLYTSRRTPYGLPRYTGNIIAIRGSRSADETNIMTQQNNHVPSMAITVSGGQLTQSSVDRIQDFVDTQIKANSNYSKFLILEGESDHDALSATGSAKIEIKPLAEAQHKDQLWQDYDKNNSNKLLRSFRLPPILVGKSEDYSKAAASVSERLAEKYVFNPEREEFDEQINKIVVQQGFRFHVWKTNSPNVTDDQDLVRILTGAERTGGLTPRISRMLLSDILNRKLPDFPEDSELDPDVPFSYSLAKLMHEAGNANQNGSFASQGQTPKTSQPNGRPAGKSEVAWVKNVLASVEGVEEDKMEEICQLLEDSLDIDSFGKIDRNFFGKAA